MAHRFNITKASDDQFKFAFAYNAETIFWSENYKQKASARSAIESLKKNAPNAATVDLSKGENAKGYRFEIVASKDGQHFVRIVASNGETLARTETYKQKSSATNAIESLKKNGPGADVLDLAIPRLPEEPLPSQELGVRFEIRDGTISLAEGPSASDIGDLRRLTSLQPLLTETIIELVEATTPSTAESNDPEHKARRHALQYLAELEREVSTINFGLLFGLGSMLQNRLYADINMSADSDLPQLTDRQRSALRDFQDLHGPFLSASSEGLSALAAAERIERNPAEEREIAQVVADVAELLGNSSDLVAEPVVETLKIASEEIGKGRQADRLTVYGLNTARNLAIVAVAGGLSAAVVAGLAGLGPLGMAAGGAFALTVVEATKKSAAFRDLAQPLTEVMDGARAADFAKFTKKSIPALRKLAGNRPEMQWLRDYLDSLDKML